MGRLRCSTCSASRAPCCRGRALDARARRRVRAARAAARFRSAASPGDQQAALFGQACFDAGHGQEHVRHRLLPADEHRARAAAFEEPPAHDDRLAARRTALRARGLGVRRRRRRAVAARRPRPHRTFVRRRGARGHRAGRGRRVPGARLHRPRQPALGCLRARHHGRAVARHDQRTHRACGARVDRVPERGGAERHAARRRTAAARASRGRRRDGTTTC